MGFGFGVSCFWQLSYANLNQAWFQILLSVGRMPIQKGEMALFSPVAVPLLSWGGSRPSPACPVLPWRPVFTFPSRCSMRGTSRVLPASPLICQNDWISDCYSVKFGFFFFFLAMPCSMWDLSSPTRDQTHAPCIGSVSLNHWTTREVPSEVCSTDIFLASTQMNDIVFFFGWLILNIF